VGHATEAGFDTRPRQPAWSFGQRVNSRRSRKHWLDIRPRHTVRHRVDIMPAPSLDLPHARIAAFCKQNGIRRLALFGSVLRDDFRPDSDIDVLVELCPRK
jgi:predicted nucleic acid-binding protein